MLEYFFLQLTTIGLENQYENYNEFYFIKQLPFNISFSLANSPNDKKDEILISYFEYHKNNMLQSHFLNIKFHKFL